MPLQQLEVQKGIESLPNFGQGVQVVQKASSQGDGLVSELHARYFQLTKAGYVFSASNSAAQAVSVALATTYTGLALSNPIGSAVDLALLKVGFALSVAPAAIASLHLIGGFSATSNVTHTTPLTTRSNLLGSGISSTATADSAATIPTPAYIASLVGGFTAAALPSGHANTFDFEGSIVIPPGGFICIGALTAVTGFGSMVWAEIPR